MPKIKVHIVESGGDFFVQPPTVSADNNGNDSLRIINATDEDLVFRLDTDLIIPAGDQTKLIKTKEKVSLPILNNAPPGVYRYQILMVKSGKKAKGNSDPVLIIDN